MQAGNGNQAKSHHKEHHRNSSWGHDSLDDRTGDEAESLRLLRDAQEHEVEAAEEGPFKWVEEIADEGLEEKP